MMIYTVYIKDRIDSVTVNSKQNNYDLFVAYCKLLFGLDAIRPSVNIFSLFIHLR